MITISGEKIARTSKRKIRRRTNSAKILTISKRKIAGTFLFS
jgi:hypothetical protein